MPNRKISGESRKTDRGLQLTNDEPRTFHIVHQPFGIAWCSNNQLGEDDNASCALESACKLKGIVEPAANRHVQEPIASKETATTFSHRVRNDSARPERSRTIALSNSIAKFAMS